MGLFVGQSLSILQVAWQREAQCPLQQRLFAVPLHSLLIVHAFGQVSKVGSKHAPTPLATRPGSVSEIVVQQISPPPLQSLEVEHLARYTSGETHTGLINAVRHSSPFEHCALLEQLVTQLLLHTVWFVAGVTLQQVSPLAVSQVLSPEQNRGQ
jgi:hypothetical protein